MPLSLPIDPPGARSLSGVLPEAIRALSGDSEWFPRARSAVVVVVDGLGAQNLAARAGHARFLASGMSKRSVARTVVPSTTASALTSLLTGTPPGEHGVVGYAVRVPDTDVVANQLTGWDDGEIDPMTWQRSVPLFARDVAAGAPRFVASRARFEGSGFTRATLRGASFVHSDDIAERARLAAALASEHAGAVVYLYIHELDTVGHKHGWEGAQWTDMLERVDGALQQLADTAASGVGILVTADHGMVDVPAFRQRLVGDGDPLWNGVRLVGGEPRMLHLYTETGREAEVFDAWSASEASRSWVFSRADAVSAGLFGATDAAVLPRIGDVLVAARAAVAYYDDREKDKRAQSMIGQHGSLTDQERIVPLLRFGAFA